MYLFYFIDNFYTILLKFSVDFSWGDWAILILVSIFVYIIGYTKGFEDSFKRKDD